MKTPTSSGRSVTAEALERLAIPSSLQASSVNLRGAHSLSIQGMSPEAEHQVLRFEFGSGLIIATHKGGTTAWEVADDMMRDFRVTYSASSDSYWLRIITVRDESDPAKLRSWELEAYHALENPGKTVLEQAGLLYTRMLWKRATPFQLPDEQTAGWMTQVGRTRRALLSDILIHLRTAPAG